VTDALTAFAFAYADRSLADYQLFAAAAAAGQI